MIAHTRHNAGAKRDRKVAPLAAVEHWPNTNHEGQYSAAGVGVASVTEIVRRFTVGWHRLMAVSDSATEPPPILTGRPFAAPPLLGVSRERSRGARWWGGGVALAGATLIGIAAWLAPDPAGVGTHRQLGLPPCGFLLATGVPCPTCGMTTAVSLLMHARPVDSLLTQPLGALLGVLLFVASVLGAWSAATGRWVEVDWYRVSPVWMAFCLGAVIVLSWGAKIAISMVRSG